MGFKRLYRLNQLLKDAKDILLPRLMIGMIDVDYLEVNEDIKSYGVDDYLGMEQELGRVAEKEYNYKNQK